LVIALLANVTATSAFAASLRFAWDASPDPSAAGYTLSFGPAPGVHTTHVDVGLVEEYELTGLTDNTNYCFVVRAYNFLADTSTPSNEVCVKTAATILVKAGGDLQAAFNQAQPGDTILLESNASFVGNFVLPAKTATSTNYITIRSSAANHLLPGPGIRMTPAYAAQLPKLRSPNSSPALSTAPGAHHYRLQYLELLANTTYTGTILSLGATSTNQDTLDEVPHDLIVDRVYIHGSQKYGQTRGIALNSASTDIVNSHVSNIKSTGSSQAIAGWNGPGPYTIANNYLEAAGQNVLFGASAPSIPNLTPSDITITGNHITKPLEWKTQSWTVRTLVELRSARSVVIDGNVLENNWGTDGGYAVRLDAAGSSTSTWSAVQDITFKNNVVRNVGSGISLLRLNATDTTQVSDITVRNNLFDAISIATTGGHGRFLLVAGASQVTVDHNTVISDGISVVVAKTWKTTSMVFTNNIVFDHGAAIDSPTTTPGLATIQVYFPLGQFFGSIYVGSNPLTYPSSNYYPATVDAVGFVSFTGHDYRLSATSIFQNGATDGADPGVDYAYLPVVP
jgi:hypothetical protein